MNARQMVPGRVLAWPGPQTRAPASSYTGATRPPQRDAEARGSGGSDAPAGGYDKATLAEDIRQLLLALGRTDQVSLVGHDIGTMVSYAYAAAHPDSVRRLALLEAPQIDETLYQFPAITPRGSPVPRLAGS